MAVSRRDVIEFGVAGALVAAAAVAHYANATPVLAFVVAALAIAVLARLVGGATEQLGTRVGSSVAGVVQSALGNLPELFIALFALREGLIGVVQSALVGSVIANSVLVLGLAFVVGGARKGTQVFSSPRARMIATLSVLAAAILAVPSLAHEFHSPAAAHAKTLSLICAGVLLTLFVLTLPGFLSGVGDEEHAPPRWTLWTTVAVLGTTGVGAAFVSDWFVVALRPATHSLGMSEAFAGLVVVAIAGNAVENVVGFTGGSIPEVRSRGNATNNHYEQSKIDAETQKKIKAGYPEIFARCRETFACFMHTPDPRGAFEVSDEEREANYERLYGERGFGIWVGLALGLAAAATLLILVGAIVLAGAPEAQNTLDQPTKVAPHHAACVVVVRLVSAGTVPVRSAAPHARACRRIGRLVDAGAAGHIVDQHRQLHPVGQQHLRADEHLHASVRCRGGRARLERLDASAGLRLARPPRRRSVVPRRRLDDARRVRRAGPP